MTAIAQKVVVPPFKQLDEQVMHAVRLRPIASLIASVAGIAFGHLSLTYAVTYALPFAMVSSSLLLVISGVFLIALGIEYKRAIFPDKHVKENHVFIEGEVRNDQGNVIGKIAYPQGKHVPILKIKTKDPREKGRVMAQLLEKPFLEFLDRYLNHLPLVLRIMVGPWHTDSMEHLKKQIEKYNVRYSPEKLEELKGIREKLNEIIERENVGYWIKRNKLSLDDVKALITFADFNKGIGAIACSAAVRKNQLIRTLDWFPFGVLGKLTFLKVYQTSHNNSNKPQHVASVAIPPGAAGLSMANDNLVITLNETTTMKSKRHLKNGTPQFLLIRELVENCSTLEEVKSYIQQHPPAASHLLTVLDRKRNGAILQLLPSGSQEIFTERIIDPKGGYVHTTNHFYDEENQMIPDTSSSKSSFKRYQAMKEALEEKKETNEVLSSVNQKYTIHSMVFTFDRSGDLVLSLNFDNSFAVSHINHEEINLSALFKEMG